MEIRIKNYDLTVTVEQPEDINTDDLLDTFVKLMHMLGYHPNSIKQSVIELSEFYNNEKC